MNKYFLIFILFVDIPDHTDPPNPGLKIDVEVHLDTDFACHSGGC